MTAIASAPIRPLEDLGDGYWLCEYVEPDEALLDRLARLEGSPWIDPHAALEQMLAHVGQTFQARLGRRKLDSPR